MSDDSEYASLMVQAVWRSCVHGGGWWIALDADGREVLLPADTPVIAAIPSATDPDALRAAEDRGIQIGLRAAESACAPGPSTRGGLWAKRLAKCRAAIAALTTTEARKIGDTAESALEAYFGGHVAGDEPRGPHDLSIRGCDE